MNSYLYNNCGRCFNFANQCLKFTSSDNLFFPIFHEGHWFVFVVAIRDGFFVFLDSVYGEDDHYQQQARSVIIPNFLKAWDDFVKVNFNFEDFVIHYATVPKQSRKYWSPHDDGIFVMKFLELWDPYVHMRAQFGAANIGDIRVKYVREMVFSNHNEIIDAKTLLSDTRSMVHLKYSKFQPSSSLLH